MNIEAYGNTSHLLRYTFHYGIAKIIPGLLGLISIVVYIRFLGAAEFGRYTTIFIAVNVCTAFIGGWFNVSIVRFLFGWQLGMNTVKKILIAFICLGSIVSVIALFVYFKIASIASLIEIVLCWLVTITSLIQGAVACIAQAKIRPIQVILSETVKSVGIIAISVSFFYIWGANTASLLAGTAFGTLLSVYPFRKLLVNESQSDDKPWPSYFFSLWKYGWPLSIWVASQLAFQWVDRITISSAFGMTTTGRFVAWSDLISRSITLPAFALATALLPLMAAATSQGHHKEANNLYKKAIGLMSILSVFLLLIVIIFGNNLFLMVFKTSDVLISNLTLPFTTGAILWQFAILIHKPIEIAGGTKAMALSIVVCLLLKLVLNLTTIPRFGLFAASISTVIAVGFYCLLSALYVKFKSVKIQSAHFLDAPKN